MNKTEKIIVLDFGGQYNQLIARRVRELNVYCEVRSHEIDIEELKQIAPKGIIFTGGPNSAYLEDSPSIDKRVFDLGIPILGICYGMQIMAHLLGGKVESAEKGEYGKMPITVAEDTFLLKDLKQNSITWMSHMDYISSLPAGFKMTANTENCPFAAMENVEKGLYGVQFHPEVNHTEEGGKVLREFVYGVCKCEGNWKMAEFTVKAVEEIKQKVGDKKVLLALSGGVDSSVVAAMISKAIGDQLTCIFVDHGLLRLNEGDEVEKIFTDGFNLNFVRVDAEKRFLDKLAGVSDPEKKRKIIGEEFIRVFEDEAKKIGKVHFLAQGTIYPDVIESGLGKSAVIKSHHNVGGLPDHVDFEEILEPLRDLFKDEVRQVGLELGLPENLVFRQPFPGPGLAVRVLGDITKEKLDILRPADAIFREELEKSGISKSLGQYFAVLTNMKTVGVMGDERTYDHVLALRSVNTVDFMTAEWSKIPLEVLDKVSNRIINECKHINRIVYDITGKPPGTIEFE